MLFACRSVFAVRCDPFPFGRLYLSVIWIKFLIFDSEHWMRVLSPYTTEAERKRKKCEFSDIFFPFCADGNDDTQKQSWKIYQL